MIRFSLFADVRADSEGSFVNASRRFRHWSSPLMSAYMGALNRLSRSTLLGPATGPIVSLTSYGVRVQSVHRTIESIGRGSMRPARIILWLDDVAAYRSLPSGLERLKARGLEVRLTENLGPHTKYFSLVCDGTRGGGRFVTADDDIIYPRWWLKRLTAAADETPGTVVCHRAHRVVLAADRVAPYAQWTSVLSTEPHATVLATGVSGVLYPVEMIEAVRRVGRQFESISPNNDDIWLHRVALDAGIPVRQVGNIPKHFWITPNSQATTLMQRNLSGANDSAIALTYGPNQVQALEGDPSEWDT